MSATSCQTPLDSDYSTKMTEIGIIEPDRLRHIPKSCRSAHELCFHLHDLMVHILRDIEADNAVGISFKIKNESEVQALSDAENILDFLSESGRGDLERRTVINHTSVALYADMLHFIHDALIALEKRKFSVAFALLRKPLKEGLMLSAWMCANETEFFESLKSNPREAFDHRQLPEEKKIEVFEKAISNSGCSEFVGAQSVYSAVFDRKNKLGLACLFDKATHLVTRNQHVATEDYNINFIFKDPRDNDIYQYIYRDLSLLLFFIHMIQIELYSRMSTNKENYISWFRLVVVGAYEALFTKGRASMVTFVNNTFGEFMTCPQCQTQISLRKVDAPKFFVTEILACASCGMVHRFPFSWLLSKGDISQPE